MPFSFILHPSSFILSSWPASSTASWATPMATSCARRPSSNASCPSTNSSSSAAAGSPRRLDPPARQWPVHEVPVLRTVHRKGPCVSVRRRPRPNRRPARGHARASWANSPGSSTLSNPTSPSAIENSSCPSPARRAGLRCLSLDHSHVLKACSYPVPAGRTTFLDACDAQRLPALRLHAPPSHRVVFPSTAATPAARRTHHRRTPPAGPAPGGHAGQPARG